MAKKGDDDIIKQARERFERSAEAEADNRKEAEADLKFARLGEQWDQSTLEKRSRDSRPALTVNKLPAYIRQVVNDSRLNKPSIKVHPADSGADVETAKIFDGLVRNIEACSDADVAYDTAIDNAASIGFGYFRVSIDYAHDDAFDADLWIERIANPFSVYGDPEGTKADSSDWNFCFVIEQIHRKTFERKYKDGKPVSWEQYEDLESPWNNEDDTIALAEYWVREEYEREIVQLSNGQVLDAEVFEAQSEVMAAMGINEVQRRTTKSHRVTQHLMTGVEVLETTRWPGKWIPVIPVYGEEVNEKGKRHLRSLIRDAKDPQRMVNYWRTTATEMVALAPKAPWVGPSGAFDTDADKWATANTEAWPYLQYDGAVPPQRQPFAGIPAGALQEALNASDDIKAIIGLFDASLGAKSNETSGRAIMARQREGDVSTFHFIDNLTRAIRHCGRILIDVIPKVYTGERIIRVLGEDGKEEAVQLGQPTQGPEGVNRVYDLAAGKYDLTVSSGPSFGTRRQEAAAQMVEFMRSFPQAAQVIGDLVAKNLDWPGSEEMAERLQALLPPGLKGDGDEAPRLTPQHMQQMQQMGAMLKQLQAENAQLKSEMAIKSMEVNIKGYDAETKRLQATQAAMTPEQVQALVIQTIQQLMTPQGAA